MPVIMRDKEARRLRLEAELQRILPKLIALGAKKIILFGSLATGNIASTSDLDLIMIKETDKRFLDRLSEVYDAVKPNLGCDILVYNQAEFEQMKKTNPFIRYALKEGKVIYEAEAP